MVHIAHFQQAVARGRCVPQCSGRQSVCRCEQSCTVIRNHGVSALACKRFKVRKKTRRETASALASYRTPFVHRYVHLEKETQGGSLMEHALRRLRDRFRRRLARITASATQMFASVTPPVRGYALQRMCPFCGLITPRSKTSCLECGKALAPATTR